MARRPHTKHRPSSVDRLDPEIRELIMHLRIDKGWSVDEIRAQLIKLGQTDVPSRSALGRHIRTLPDMVSEMREVEMLSRAMAKELGDKTASDLLSLNGQMLMANMFKLALAEKDGAPIQFSPKEAKDFADALRSIALTRKTDLDVVEKEKAIAAAKAREEERKEMQQKLADANKRGEIDPDALERARRIMGFD